MTKKYQKEPLFAILLTNTTLANLQCTTLSILKLQVYGLSPFNVFPAFDKKWRYGVCIFCAIKRGVSDLYFWLGERLMHIGNIVSKKKLPRVRSLRRPVRLLEAAPAPIPVPPDWPVKKQVPVPVVLYERDRR